MAHLLDERICSSYKLTPNNYIAYDLRYRNNDFAGYYTQDGKKSFVNRLLSLTTYEESCDIEELMVLFLGLYAIGVESLKIYGKISL